MYLRASLAHMKAVPDKNISTCGTEEAKINWI